MKTSLYVDGFNFYYGMYRIQQRFCCPADKWLNWTKLAHRLTGTDSTVHKIHYFTSHVHRSERDPSQNLRQILFFRAIDNLPGVEIHVGKHIAVKRKGRLISPKPADFDLPQDTVVSIQTFEEKGSDVNLAVQLLDDAWSGEIDRAIVVSNDTDLISAITLARRHIRVDVASPQDTLAAQMRKSVQYSWIIDPAILRECRMDSPTLAIDGTPLYPPRSWQLETWPDEADADSPR